MSFNGFYVIADEPDFIVVNKMPGIPMHQEDNQPGLIDLIRSQTGLSSLFQIHRLDNLTSGVMVFGKSAAVASELGEAWQSKKVQKFYIALSSFKPSKKQGLIAGDMEKGRNGSWKLLRSKLNPALTRFFSASIAPGIRAFLLKPYTGKTHQIRVAMKSLGCPILGDGRYSGESADRGYLHAYQLAFALNGVSYRYQAIPNVGDKFSYPVLHSLLMNEWHQPELLNWPE
ncbi:TIGR01621 family pseudouridine synthase [Leeia sp. TBRC 13508]|uniref:TIGR01621 family pseudouridine synthase n=1 Tax=Leeia speluncae TaxID=2884804 RepID=A0ABS8DAE7_9NEIS|nr:TIGR01621 family pseudouridine synthase [Leeia speluncae]MCB6185182.1 TIGR01621 family pseudouridine synthase [Leeia speluncae]